MSRARHAALMAGEGSRNYGRRQRHRDRYKRRRYKEDRDGRAEYRRRAGGRREGLRRWRQAAWLEGAGRQKRQRQIACKANKKTVHNRQEGEPHP